MRTIAFLLVSALALAGCTSGGGEAGETGSPTSSTMTQSSTNGTTTATTSTGSNAPPTAQLAVSTPGGGAPLNVTFTVDGADDDADSLTWTLDADGDGAFDAEGTDADFPRQVNYTYVDEGNYTAVLTVDDGIDQANATVEVTVAAGAPAGQTVEGSWTLSHAGCGSPYDAWAFGTPAAGVTWGEFEVDPATYGHAYQLDFVITGTGLGFVFLDFYDADDALLEGGTYAFEPETGFSGTVPAGAAHALVGDCFTAGGTSFTYTSGPA